MDKEQALNEFLKSLRVALTNSLAYSKDHPYFKECAENLKNKTDVLFGFLSPIKIVFSPDSLYIDARPLENKPLYSEIAHIFHLRKIKSLEIVSGVTLQDLIIFLIGISRPVKELLGDGGMRKNLYKEGVRRITVEELDYSEVLRSKGQDAKNVWSILVKDALASNDRQKIMKFAEDFHEQIGRLRESDLLEDEEVRKNISQFLVSLREFDREKSSKCTVEMFKSVSKFKDALQDENIEKLRALFKHLSEEDFASLLKDEILEDKDFDALSFQLFSRIAGIGNDVKIASYVLKDLEEGRPVYSDPANVKKVQDLLSSTNNQFISEVYRNTLSSLVKGIKFEAGVSFDHGLLRANYNSLVQGFFTYETDKAKLSIILERVADVFAEAADVQDFAYVKKILAILKEKRKTFSDDPGLFEVLDWRVADFAEKMVWQQKLGAQEEELLVEAMTRPAAQVQTYLEKIFLERKISPNSLKLFFRFYAASAELFYQALNEHYADMEFVLEITQNMDSLHLASADQVVRRAISSGSDFMKLKLLKEISSLTYEDKAFLISMLEKPDISLKKDALLILARCEASLSKEAADKLFQVSSFLGFKNDLLIENLSLAYETGLKECAGYVMTFSKKPFFWNTRLRQKAIEILEKWNA